MTTPQVGDKVSVIVEGTVDFANDSCFHVANSEIYFGPNVQVEVLPQPPKVGDMTQDFEGLPNGTFIEGLGVDDLVKVAGCWFNLTTGSSYSPSELNVPRRIKSLP